MVLVTYLSGSSRRPVRANTISTSAHDGPAVR